MALSRLNSDWLSENLWDPQQVAREMVDQVQTATKLSPQMSKTAVQIVLNKVAETMPSTVSNDSAASRAGFPKVSHQSVRQKSCMIRFPYVFQLQSNLWRALMSKIETMNTTTDHDRLTQVFKGLYLTKNDEQQRSWPLHQDESTINTMLEQLYTMLVEIDSKICAKVLPTENYEYITTLVAYYQMETRNSLRVWMLRVSRVSTQVEH